MEKLYIGDAICVTVVRMEGGQVRLGIEAPREVPVVRAELKPKTPGPSPLESVIRPATTTTPKPPSLGTGIRRRGPSR
ncbi:MAG: carbon storage regulator [Isosphaeraceae bacterium]